MPRKSNNPIANKIKMQEDVMRIIASEWNEIYTTPTRVADKVLFYLKESGWLKETPEKT